MFWVTGATDATGYWDAQGLVPVLDMLLDNGDRHGGNFVVTDGGKLVAIDHGYAVMTRDSPDLSTVQRRPKDSAPSAEERTVLADRLRTTDWSKITAGYLRGTTAAALKARAKMASVALENNEMKDLFARMRLSLYRYYSGPA